MKSKPFKFFCSPLLVFILVGCSNEMEDENIVKNNTVLTEDIQIIQSLGFDISGIIENDSYYLVEEDIMIQKSDMPSYKIQTRQAQWSELISYQNQKTITVGIANSIPTGRSRDNWRSEILKALELWNPLSNIKMTYTTASNPDILVSSDNGTLSNNIIASATWPANGKPGSNIIINLDYYNNKNVPTLQKLYNMVHELGHCLGLRHTNWSERNEYNPPGIHIPGTPGSDRNSIMNGGTAEYSWKGFSVYDKLAIEKLYPKFEASLVNFPEILPINQLNINRTITLVCNQQVTGHYWSWTGGMIVSGHGTPSVIVSPGSPVTFSLGVHVITERGEKYVISQMVNEKLQISAY